MLTITVFLPYPSFIDFLSILHPVLSSLNIEVPGGSSTIHEKIWFAEWQAPQPWAFIAMNLSDVRPVIEGHYYVLKNVPSGNAMTCEVNKVRESGRS